ncbi:MAG: hypothetical protein M1825_001636 [Sarcosagium campestre]|nr:MAG: hypothetical protein M1825_001636 [Sarcosagium campestre]
MAGFFKSVYDWLMRLFWATEMDITMIGLQNAGKTSLLRVLAGGEFTIDSIPTVGFNMKRVQKGHVTLKCWDLGGQPRFIVDAADQAAIPVARDELHALLEKRVLQGIPLLVLGNKSDLPEKLSVDELIDVMDLKYYSYRCNSRWNDWGRWVVLVAIFFFFFIIFFVLSCLSSRRRRRRGLSPYYGTGWLAGKTPQGQQAQYGGAPGFQQPYGQQPQYGQQQWGGQAPDYTAPPQQSYYGNPAPVYREQSYGQGEQVYGQQQTGVELQSPQSSYQPANAGYTAPPGPPPGQKA